MVELEEIKNRLLSGKNIKDAFKNFDWKIFEKAVAEVFSENNFLVKRNFRFKTKNRYEMDIIAVRSGMVICADCKEWSAGRYKTSALKKAVEKQEKRVNEFKKFFSKNFIVQKILKAKNTFLFLPILITLMEEDLIEQNETYVVPFEKLNTFLLEIENYT